MNQQHGLRIMYALFLLNVIVIAWQDIKADASPIGWPRPSRFVGLAVAFSLLSVVAEVAAAELAAVLAAGLTLGLVMNTFSQSNTSGTASGSQSGTVNASQPSSTGLTGSIQV